jgi:small redox-active disulfide protein 2
MDIKVLGTGCANCKRTVDMIQQAAQARGIAVNIEKVEDIRAIMGYGILSTPGVVVNGEVVHAGGLPSREKIEQWLAGNGVCCGAHADQTPAESASSCCSATTANTSCC